ncbi:proline-rich protein 2-like [Lepus europaeus]|uniref:proline-rich protein 2-like n=1 Tax=Lepus europaeus TaxID=9983 RepID=UPI002B4712D4|nr:proline-rich protein 2-like [Lepus europaeus]
MGRPLARTQPRSPVSAAGVHWKLRSRWPGRSLGVSIPGESASESPVRPRERWAAAALTEPGTAQGHLPAGVLGGGGVLCAAGRAGGPRPRPRPPAPGSRPAVQGHVPSALSPVQSLPRGPAGPPDAAGPPPCLPRPAPRAVDGALGSGSAPVPVSVALTWAGPEFPPAGARSRRPRTPRLCRPRRRVSERSLGPEGAERASTRWSTPQTPTAARAGPGGQPDPNLHLCPPRGRPQRAGAGPEPPSVSPTWTSTEGSSRTRTSICVPHVDVHRGQQPDPNLHPCPPCGRPQRAGAGPEPPSVSPMWTSTEGSSAPGGQRGPALGPLWITLLWTLVPRVSLGPRWASAARTAGSSPQQQQVHRGPA